VTPQPERDQPTVALDHGGAMPLIGLGTWQMTRARCQAAVRTALEVGYRHIDTATIYRNEGRVGRAVRDSGVPREQVFVTTKLPPGAAGRARPGAGPRRRGQQLQHRPAGRADRHDRRGAPGQPDPVDARPVRRRSPCWLSIAGAGSCWRATAPSRTPTCATRAGRDRQVVVIPKSATPERIAANFDVFGFSLTNEELGRIDALSTTRRW
jgi:aryl-alcohol dehydrogenase-like predicted oxidoreductase